MLLTAYILDDEAAARERMVYLIQHFLDEQVKIIGQSGNPHDALKQLPALSPDILFLDVEMPGMSGLEVASGLSAASYKGKIIFVTAFDHYSIKAIRSGAFDYIMKPVDVDELKQAIHRAVTLNGHVFRQDVIEYYGLSKREVELVQYLSLGMVSEEIAANMFLSRHTIETHKRNIYQKTGTRNSIELLNLLRGQP